MRLRRAELSDMPAVGVLHRTTMRVSLAYLPDLHTAEEDRWFFTETLFPANTVWLAEDAGSWPGMPPPRPAGSTTSMSIRATRAAAPVGSSSPR